MTRRTLFVSNASWRLITALLLGVIAVFSVSAWSGGPEPATASIAYQAADSGELIPVRLQLQWSVQAQFAGYLAALDQGFYEAEGLDVQVLEGAVDLVPQDVVARGEAEFGIAWVPKALVTRESGTALVNVAQIFQRSVRLRRTPGVVERLGHHPAGIGVMDRALWEQTIAIATTHEVLSALPDPGAFRRDLAQSALADLAAQGADVTGATYRPRQVEITPGGE